MKSRTAPTFFAKIYAKKFHETKVSANMLQSEICFVQFHENVSRKSFTNQFHKKFHERVTLCNRGRLDILLTGRSTVQVIQS